MFKHPSTIPNIFRYTGMNQNFGAVKIQLELYWRFSFTFVRKECDKHSIVHLFPQFWKKGNNKDRIHKSIITLHYNSQYLVTVRFNNDKIDHILLYINICRQTTNFWEHFLASSMHSKYKFVYPAGEILYNQVICAFKTNCVCRICVVTYQVHSGVRRHFLPGFYDCIGYFDAIQNA